jgi:ketose-bisphosphate aldolase
MKKLLWHARENSYAVGYFEALSLDAMLSVVCAAEKADSPVIIGFGGQFLNSRTREKAEDVFVYGAAARAAAERAAVPVAVLMNEADDPAMVYRSMSAGFNAVMYQNPNDRFEETLKITEEICRIAHYQGIDVESEVGELPMADVSTGNVTEGSSTDVEQARDFVRATNIDALAVAVGNIHLLERRKSELDFVLLEKLGKEIDIPLVLHGGSGLSEKDIKKAIAMGVCKINVGTALKRVYIKSLGAYFEERDLENTDPHIIIGWGGDADILDRAHLALENKVADFINIFGSAGKAGSLMKKLS